MIFTAEAAEDRRGMEARLFWLCVPRFPLRFERFDHGMELDWELT